MVSRYIIIGEYILLTQSGEIPFKGDSFSVELRLPLEIYKKITDLLNHAEYLFRIEGNLALARKTYLDLVELAAPYARSESDRRTLKTRAESLINLK